MKTSISLAVVAIGLVLLSSVALNIGHFLVVEQLHKADVIVVLAGDTNDRRYWKGIELLRDGYGSELLVDAADQTTMFGHTYADWARQFIAETNAGQPASVKVCPIGEDSTVGETKYVRACLADKHAESVLLVTSDFHTRRALSIFRNRLPMYTWYVAAAADRSTFGTRWWGQREWAKTALQEWEKLVWWNLAERWQRAS